MKKTNFKQNTSRLIAFLVPFFVTVIIFTSSFFTVYVDAAYVPGGGGTGNVPGGNTQMKLSNPLKGANTITEFIKNILQDVVIPLGAVVAVLAVIYSGFLMVMARGKPEALKTAKASFFTSVIGTAIILGAWVIAQAIDATVKQITN